ncbi:sodium channel subunit beta-1 [Thunnus maccoyii]|uniref:sodium channel subunit beta-1 n=1 Tax=Thunnus maccoyii TaxID=8240 RepID=UPI001C4AD6A8|nr:sodium channel subunit beta-1 [Thunnus maccoyii]
MARSKVAPAEMICQLPVLVVFSLFVFQCHGGCAEVDSLTEAVAGEGFLLGCISCKRREEVSARATVDWHFKPPGEEEFRHIFHYDHPSADILHDDFSDRLNWHGTQNSDIQIGAVYINNVTFNDTGTYRCTIHRTLFLPLYNQDVIVEKVVELSVVAEANRELTSVISEIMMYVLIVVLQLWLIVILAYCYKKISAEHEAREARKALRAQAELLELKDICDGVQLEVAYVIKDKKRSSLQESSSVTAP